MKFIRKYDQHLERLKVADVHYIIESDEEYDILLDLVEEGLFTRLGNWMFKAPKIRKLMRQANTKRYEAAQVENEQREKIQKLIDADEYVDINALGAVLKKKITALNNIADEYEREAQAVAGTNTYLNKVKRIEELKGIMDVNNFKYKNATEEEKWTYDNFAKKAKPIIRQEQQNVDNASKGRTVDDEDDSPEKRMAIRSLEKLIEVEPDALSAWMNFTRSYVANKLGERKTARTANINRQVVDAVSKIAAEYHIGLNSAFDVYFFMYKDLNPRKKEIDAETAYLCYVIRRDVESDVFHTANSRDEVIDTAKILRDMGLVDNFPAKKPDNMEIKIAHAILRVKEDFGIRDTKEAFHKWAEKYPEEASAFFGEVEDVEFPKEYVPKNDRDFAREAEEESERITKDKK